MNKLLAALAGFAALRSRQPHSADTIKVVVPFAAGGPVDMLARVVAADMQTAAQDRNGGREPRRGGRRAGDRAVARAPADGKTLLFAKLGSHVISAALRAASSATIRSSRSRRSRSSAQVPMLVVVSADSPAQELADLIAKAKTEKLSYASAGAGSTMHIIGEMFNAEAGSRPRTCPTRASRPALNDLLGGHIQFLNADLPVLEPLVQERQAARAGDVRAERSPLLPDLPTSAELGYPGMLMEQLVRHAGAGRHAGRRAGRAGEGDARSDQEPERSPRAWPPAACAARLDGKGFRAKLASDVAYWGPQIKKLGISGE